MQHRSTTMSFDVIEKMINICFDVGGKKYFLDGKILMNPQISCFFIINLYAILALIL